MTDWFTWEHVWLLIGFAGQALFMSRFIVQWWASEKAGRSVVPVMFWYFSVGGGIVLLVYARNLYLIFAERAAAGRENGEEPPSATK
jgi:lipid-A-disaccharide synthase-like uncharacterized protein